MTATGAYLPPSERHKALTEAWQAVQREVTPLGGYSPWNDGFTTALNKALNAILALRDEAVSPVEATFTQTHAGMVCALLRESRTDPDRWTRPEREAVLRLHGYRDGRTPASADVVSS